MTLPGLPMAYSAPQSSRLSWHFSQKRCLVLHYLFNVVYTVWLTFNFHMDMCTQKIQTGVLIIMKSQSSWKVLQDHVSWVLTVIDWRRLKIDSIILNRPSSLCHHPYFPYLQWTLILKLSSIEVYFCTEWLLGHIRHLIIFSFSIWHFTPHLIPLWVIQRFVFQWAFDWALAYDGLK